MSTNPHCTAIQHPPGSYVDMKNSFITERLSAKIYEENSIIFSLKLNKISSEEIIGATL